MSGGATIRLEGYAMERYEHKVVLITGAGDIAGATARRLLSEGGKVALTDFSREALDQEARMLKEEGWDEDRVMTIPGDVRSLEDCQAAAAEVKEKWGRIDVLVATAGILRHFPTRADRSPVAGCDRH